MAYRTPEGSAFYVSQTFASAKTVTSVTNANPAVATSTTHGYSDLDEVLFDSGWEDATNSVYRVDQLTTDTFSLLGLNSSNTNSFAAGTGTGTTKKISSWIEIPQVLTISSQGGGPRNITVNPIKKRNGIIIPTGFEPATTTLTLGFDPSQANWSTLLDISRSQTYIAYKSVAGNGAATYGWGLMSISEQPIQQAGQVDQVSVQLAFQGRLISYA